MNVSNFKVAVIGAGVSGLTCARGLQRIGIDVVVFDKARGPGGRISTRRHEAMQFDHGAQYFTVRSAAFSAEISKWIRQGSVAAWPGKVGSIGYHLSSRKELDERFVGKPRMSALARTLSNDLQLKLQTPVTRIDAVGSQWQLADDAERSFGPFDTVILAVPAPQAFRLTPKCCFNAKLGQIRMAPCWAVISQWEHRLSRSFDALFVADSPITWIARDSSKPGRPEGESWVLHASPEWSTEHLEKSADEVVDILVDELSDLFKKHLRPTFVAAHRWRYALPLNTTPEDCLFDPDLRLGACGDWCVAPRVEGAFLSGLAMARKLESYLNSKT